MYFKRAQSNDWDTYLEIRNDELSVKNSASGQTRDRSWYNNHIDDPKNRMYLVYTDHLSSAIGYFGFSIDTIDEKPHNVLSWALHPSNRGRGLGNKLLVSAIEHFYSSIPMIAVIKHDNVPSRKMAVNAGFNPITRIGELIIYRLKRDI